MGYTKHTCVCGGGGGGVELKLPQAISLLLHNFLLYTFVTPTHVYATRHVLLFMWWGISCTS